MNNKTSVNGQLVGNLMRFITEKFFTLYIFNKNSL